MPDLGDTARPHSPPSRKPRHWLRLGKACFPSIKRGCSETTGLPERVAWFAWFSSILVTGSSELRLRVLGPQNTQGRGPQGPWAWLCSRGVRWQRSCPEDIEQQRAMGRLPLPPRTSQAPSLTPSASFMGTQMGHLSGQDEAQNFPVDSHIHGR